MSHTKTINSIFGLGRCIFRAFSGILCISVCATVCILVQKFIAIVLAKMMNVYYRSLANKRIFSYMKFCLKHFAVVFGKKSRHFGFFFSVLSNAPKMQFNVK